MKQNNIWEKNYKKGRYNKYPFDEIVSFILSYFKKNRNKTRILDLGCGGGNNTKFLVDEKFDTYAVDGSSESLSLTKKLLKNKFNKKKMIVSEFKKIP